MHKWSEILRRNRTVIILFTVMVLLPSLFLTLVSLRAIRGEDAQQRFHQGQRQREITHLLEAGLDEWLFSRQPDAALSRSFLRFTLDGGRVAFPDLNLTIAPDRNKGPVPSTLRDEEHRLTDEPVPEVRSVEEIYYPRIQAFLRDLNAGRNSGAQYFRRLKAMIVLIPGTNNGYVLGGARLVQFLNGRLRELTAAENFNGAVSIVEGLSAGPSSESNQNPTPAEETIVLGSYPFFQVTFTRNATVETVLNFRKNIFLYSMALLLLVTVLGVVLMYRAVSHEIVVSQLKADFVSAVSHEFRTPLSSIMALSERLESERVFEKERLRQYHATLRRDARRLSILVDKLLDFAQLEEGKKQYSFDRINLVLIAAEAVKAFQLSNASEQVHLVEAHESPYIVGDSTAIIQCLQNLIENAIKYSPPGSPVTVRCGRENGRAFVEVRDRGIGIPPSDRQKIFEKFYRAENASTLNVQGTGIGLALVQRIIDIHHGSIAVESNPGEGSLFRLVFPEDR